MNKGLDLSHLSGRVDHCQLHSWLVKEMSISRTYLIWCLGIKGVCFPTLLTVDCKGFQITNSMINVHATKKKQNKARKSPGAYLNTWLSMDVLNFCSSQMLCCLFSFYPHLSWSWGFLHTYTWDICNLPLPLIIYPIWFQDQHLI